MENWHAKKQIQIAQIESQKMTTKSYPQKDHILKSPEKK